MSSKDIVRALRQRNIPVEQYYEHFNPGDRDHVWIPRVAQRGWVILAKDKHFKSHQLERSAFVNAKARAFILTSGNLTGTEMAAAFIKAMPKIRRMIENHPPPFIAHVQRNGNVYRVYPQR